MDESCIYEGMRAVCAVLAELEAPAHTAPALRLAERHLHLLADLAAGRQGLAPAGADESGPAGAPAPAVDSAPRGTAAAGGRHVLLQ